MEELAAVYRELSYDSYRRLALAAGAPPVSPRGVRARQSGGGPGLADRQSRVSCSVVSAAAAGVGSPVGRTPGRPPDGRLPAGKPTSSSPGTPVAICRAAPALLPVEAVLRQQRRNALGEPGAVLGGHVGPAGVQLLVARHELRDARGPATP